MARRFWSAPAAPVGYQSSLQADNQGPQSAQSLLLDPSDLVFPAPGGGTLRVPVGGGPATPVNGTGNGNLWYYDQTSGLWVPSPNAPADFDVPRWNATLNRYDFVEHTSAGALQPFDDEGASTLALYDFSTGTFTDLSGNGQDLVAGAGTVGFSYVYPGVLGACLGSNTALLGPVGTVAGITGDITLEVICQTTDDPTSTQMLMQYAGSGETEGVNALWGLGMPSMSVVNVNARRLTWVSEHGAGIDDTFTSSGSTVVGWIHNVASYGATRIGNVIQPYYMGVPMGPPSAALTAPTGGTSSRIVIGSAGGTVCIPGIYFSMRVTQGGKSAAQMKASYNRTLGPAFGRIP